ncbi:MAG: non-homologous end-joining DNA ligase LigD [Candidatus Njordarchaeales archaeon]
MSVTGQDKRVIDRVLLLLAIKPQDKLVDFSHIYEKVNRDCGASKEEILKALRELMDQGFIERVGDKYRITEDGRQEAWKLAYDPKMNLSYRLVFLARYYYPRIADLILPFLRDRPVTVVKVFSDDNDPIRSIKPIFSRYAKLKPRKYNFINSRDELLKYVNAHAIDFIPYVHRLGNDYPDWLIIDIDAGDSIKEAGEVGFQLIKEITWETCVVIQEDLGMHPCVKFSGSRGFQIWLKPEKPLGSFEDYRRAVEIIRDLVEEKLKGRYDELRSDYGDIFEIPITTTTVAKKELRRRRILLDWSSLKPEGDVRAPFSMHYRTGLVSVPISLNDIKRFSPKLARVEEVIKRKEEIAKAFELKPSPTDILARKMGKGGLLEFII